MGGTIAVATLCVVIVAVGAIAPVVSQGEDVVGPPPQEPLSEDGLDGIAVGDSGTSHTWSTTATGTRVARVTFNYGAAQTCVVKAKASGSTSSSPWLLYFGHDSVGRVWQAVQLEDLLAPGGMATHAHVSGVAVTDALPTGLWVAEVTLSVNAAGSQSFLAAGWALRPALGNPDSIRITVTCPSSVTVTALEAGTVAHAWKPFNMRGGVGHTTGAGPDTTSDLLDSTSDPVAASIGRLRFRSEDLAAAGHLLLRTPSGTSNTALIGDDDVFVDGGSGNYAATLTRVGVGEGQKTILLVVGTNSVGSL